MGITGLSARREDNFQTILSKKMSIVFPLFITSTVYYLSIICLPQYWGSDVKTQLKFPLCLRPECSRCNDGDHYNGNVGDGKQTQ